MKTILFTAFLLFALDSSAGIIECRYNTNSKSPILSIWASLLVETDSALETQMSPPQRISYISFNDYEARDKAFKKCKAIENDWSIENCRKKSDPKQFFFCAYNKNIGAITNESYFGNTYNNEVKKTAKAILTAVSNDVLNH